tara:strand:- start:490 stop:2967 length:2478 start_codon:yes stop_codon:yes gene_type:complete
MATPQLSPGVLVREVDLTVGRADNVLDNIGAIAGPFQIGPVDEAIDISTEEDFISAFGKPLSTDRQYEYWMSASSYLTYGGVLKVVRTDGDLLNNANAGVGIASTSSTYGKVKNYDDYKNNAENTTNWTYAAKNPGTWGNGIKVCQIDDLADQILGINTSNLAGVGLTIGYGITASLGTQANKVSIPGAGSTDGFVGYIKGIITGVTTDTIGGNSTVDVKFTSRVSASSTSYTDVLNTTSINAGLAATNRIYTNSIAGLSTGTGITVKPILPGISSLSANDASHSIVSIGDTFVTLGAVVNSSSVSAGVAVTFKRLVTIGGTETLADYKEGSTYAEFKTGTVHIVGTDEEISASPTVVSKTDWYDEQKLGLTNATIFWKSIAPKPSSNVYTTDRNGKGDGMHIVVVDDEGNVTGIKGNTLEKHTFLSKAKDGVSNVNAPEKVWYKNYIADNSQYVYAGYNASNAIDTYHETAPRATGFSGTSFTPVTNADSLWGLNAQDVTYSSLGNVTYTLGGGVDYGANKGMSATLANLMTSYDLFGNKDEIEVDYLIMGPGCTTEDKSQAKANKLLTIAGDRKDCMAVISPHRANVVNVTNTTTQTNNVINFFGPLSSSSYGVFDSGYKYTYDRFNNEFRYIPCNADVAGMMCRTSLTAYPWFSPAGQQRGVLNNGIKLAYNPTKAQRDKLYPSRINSFITTPGVGTILFGDKTALAYASAFDRINVRRLFLTIEQALEKAAQAQLFELNDELTRANFRNIVEPYLRDIQAKRGLYGFLVVCDTTNNTPDIIDNNEFRADIFLKPAKSINFITLTFVATRTGVSFEEVVGRV